VFDAFYRHRSLTAALAGLAVATAAFVTLPSVAGQLKTLAYVAATPGCDGSQNPFLGSATVSSTAVVAQAATRDAVRSVR
jgi:hypothetical protein